MITSGNKPGQFLRNHFKQSPLTQLLVLIAGATVIILATTTGIFLGGSDLLITLTSGDIFLVDNNKGCDVEPHAAFVGFEICNTSGSIQTNLDAKLHNFTNPQFELTGGQDSIQTIDTLNIGECKTLFWYVKYDCSGDGITTNIDISISDSTGDVISQTETFTTINTIDAGAGGRILTSDLVSDSVIGTVLTYDCEYAFGTIAEGSPLIFQPAGNLDFNAECFQLVGAEVLSSEISGVGVGDLDILYYGSIQKHTGFSHNAVIRYYFKSQCNVGDTTTLKGFSGLISGQSFKRYNLGKEELTNEPLLPVTWNWIKAEWQGNKGQISWGANGALEGEYYTIERSRDGTIFENLDRLPVNELRTAPDEFSFTDPTAGQFASSSIYYRLKHVDLDGVISYSKIEELKAKNAGLEVEVFPNPASEFTQIRCSSLNGGLEYLRVFNISGQEMYKATLGGANNTYEQRLDIHTWPAGQYFVEIIGGDEKQTKSFLKR